MIAVFVDGSNKFHGSEYLSSETIGDYETYIAKDLVNHIDANYRTIAHRSSRGVIVNPGQQVIENLEGDEDPSYGNVLIGVKPVDQAGTALLDDVLKNAGPITEPTVEDFSRVFFTSLSAGLNMIDIPLKPTTLATLPIRFALVLNMGSQKS